MKFWSIGINSGTSFFVEYQWIVETFGTLTDFEIIEPEALNNKLENFMLRQPHNQPKQRQSNIC